MRKLMQGTVVNEHSVLRLDVYHFTCYASPMDTYENGFPRSHVFQSDEQMERFSFRAPQGDLREMLAIDPSKPHLADALCYIFGSRQYGSCVNEYRRLNESGAAQVIWEQDIPGGVLSQDAIPNPWDWEVKQRLKKHDDVIRPYDFLSRDLEVIARGWNSHAVGQPLLRPWMIGKDGVEVNYAPEKHGEKLRSLFLDGNSGDIYHLVSGLLYVPSGEVGLSNTYRSAIEILGSPRGSGEHALKAVLCAVPGVSVSFPELAKNLALYNALAEEYNPEWAQAAYEWVE